MAHVIRTYAPLLTTGDGRVYAARSVGRDREDGTWEGWLEFVPSDGSPVLRSARETTQPNLTDLEYWATGLTAVYLEGALERTLTPPPVITVPAPEKPAYDEPASPAKPIVVTVDAGLLEDLKKEPGSYRQTDLFDARAFPLLRSASSALEAQRFDSGELEQLTNKESGGWFRKLVGG